MGLEIERKFLLQNEDWREISNKETVIKQGYLNTEKERTVRVRLKGEKGYLTIKGANKGSVRAEFEYEIPKMDALVLLKMCKRPIIEKTRYLVKEDDLTWEVDIFESENEGLEVAEVELEHENQKVVIPNWVGKEVTNDARYYNSNLVKHPFSKWNK